MANVKNKRVDYLDAQIKKTEDGPVPRGKAAIEAEELELHKLRSELALISAKNWRWLDPVSPAIPNNAGAYTPGFLDAWAKKIGAENAKELEATSGTNEFGEPTAAQATSMGITPSPTQSGTSTAAPTTEKSKDTRTINWGPPSSATVVTITDPATESFNALVAVQAKIDATPKPTAIVANDSKSNVAQTVTTAPPMASATPTQTITQTNGIVPLASSTGVTASFNMVPPTAPTSTVPPRPVPVIQPTVTFSVPELPPAPNIMDTPFTLVSAGGMSLPLFFKDPQVNMYTFETPSALLVMKKSSAAIMYQTNKFLLQSITKPQQEKFQVIETFGRPHVFFYGERTRMYTIQGILLDGFKGGSPDDLAHWEAGYKDRKKLANKNMWATAMQDFYDRHLRGTALKDEGNIAALYVNGWLIKGYPVGLTIMKDANTMPDAVTFQMSWVIEKEILLRAPDVEYQYQKFDQNAPLIKEMNKLAQLQSDYIKFRDDYITKFSDGGGTAAERNQSNEKYKNAGGAVTAQQKILNDMISADKGKARKLLNMD